MKKRTRWPRRSWTAGEIAPALSAQARDQLTEANSGFLAAARLEDLDADLRVLVREPERLDASVKRRRAELAKVQQLAAALRIELRELHPRSNDILAGTLLADWKWAAGDLQRLRKALGTLGVACATILAGMGAGRPDMGRRDAVVRAVCAWVDSLEPDPKAVGRHLLSRQAKGERLRVGLRRGGIDLKRRRRSVEAVLEALGFSAEIAMDERFLRRVLGK